MYCVSQSDYPARIGGTFLKNYYEKQKTSPRRNWQRFSISIIPPLVNMKGMSPRIEATKKLAKILDTTVGYLSGETEQADLFKDPRTLQRLQDINKLPEKGMSPGKH